jgi:hypothetical protein
LAISGDFWMVDHQGKSITYNEPPGRYVLTDDWRCVHTGRIPDRLVDFTVKELYDWLLNEFRNP